MARLSVNVNKVATLRNARGGDNPNLVQTVQDLIGFGVQGITVHPRPDERHIKKEDVFNISKAIDVEFNIEGYPSDDFVNMILEVRPEQTTLVPDPPEVLTSNAGWKISENIDLLAEKVARLKTSGTRVSLFYDPYDFEKNSQDMKLISEKIEADRIELYTEMFATAFATSKKDVVTKVYSMAAIAAKEAGLGVNAGHDLDLENLGFLLKSLPMIDEVSIGHALVCDALYMGWEETIRKYLKECQ